MKLVQYLEKLNKLTVENPETLNLTVIYSRDDEGNGHQEVWNPIMTGIYEDGEFEEEQYLEEKDKKNINAIRIN